MIAGVLVIDKPSGPTSHDLVRLARRALGETRIGHCGTLDPMATGVLVLAVGAATRLVSYLASGDKTYEASVRFGSTTDTYDRTGRVVASSPARPGAVDVERALARFRGPILQQPPVYSAKKVGGTPAHRLARRDQSDDLALAPATVTVYSLELLAFDGEVASLRLRVSAGFYVRSLAHDLGQTIGTGAVLDSLRRVRSGDFGLDEAVTADALAAGPRQALAERLVPLERLLPELPVVHLSAHDAARVRCGGDVAVEWPVLPPSGTAGGTRPGSGVTARRAPRARLFHPDGRLLAIAVAGPRPGLLHPSVVLG